MSKVGLAALALALAGCASKEREIQSTQRGDAGGDATAPHTITLTMYPFWETDSDANGGVAPLDGVEVCVKRARPQRQKDQGALQDFTEVQGVCTTTSGRDKVVLTGVPALSELILTATRDGYRSKIYPVTTWQWDQDATDQTDLHQMNLTPAAVFPFDAGSPGSIELTILSCWVNCSWVGGERVSLDPPPPVDGGPFYMRDWNVVPGATASVPGTVPSEIDASYAPTSRTAFGNLPPLEYSLTLHQPNVACNVWAGLQNTLYGYSASAPNTIYVPVLEGYSTSVVAECRCFARARDGSCLPVSEAGAP